MKNTKNTENLKDIKAVGQISNGKNSENKIQSESYIWFHNTYPKLRGLLCYNLNNSKNEIDGAKNKALGLQAGRADMVLYYKGIAYMIEFKTENGIQSKKQKSWQSLIEKHNFNYYIVRNKNEFELIIKNIIPS